MMMIPMKMKVSKWIIWERKRVVFCVLDGGITGKLPGEDDDELAGTTGTTKESKTINDDEDDDDDEDED